MIWHHYNEDKPLFGSSYRKVAKRKLILFDRRDIGWIVFYVGVMVLAWLLGMHW